MIQLLPDHIANQIAAGEVVQRPASVVKELLENAVDAGATSVNIIVKDAGRTLLQVIDNGSGMSPADARMAFERHATSKIHTLDDLENIYTFGFRGEALASIAAVSEVEIKTRCKTDELGTQLVISASTLSKQDPAACDAGTAIAVRNLFFNVPARRKFLKSDAAELRHIVTEFQRVALCHPKVALKLTHNQTELYKLPAANLHQRIVHLMGKDINQQLIDIQVSTSLINIKGFVGKPETAKRTAGNQFFFVNKRYFKSPYFQKAVLNAYEQLLPEHTIPAFFIYFELPPEKIDVNIHPAKIEVKFEDDHIIFQMLHAVVRESLGKFAVTPSLDFDQEGAPEIPVFRKGMLPDAPQVNVDKNFNPFREERKSALTPPNWRTLYEGLPARSEAFEFPQEAEQTTMECMPPSKHNYIQLKGRYLITTVKSGLMFIDSHRAQQRILYERFLNKLENHLHETQQEIFPQTIELSPMEYTLLEEVSGELKQLGYDIRPFGNNAVVLNGQPDGIPSTDAKTLIASLLHELQEKTDGWREQRQKKLAASLAKAAGSFKEHLSQEQAQTLIDALFSCQSPDITPDGKPTLHLLLLSDIDKKFLK